MDKLQEALRHFQIARNFRGLKQPKKVDSVRAQAFKDAEFQNNISASSRLLWLSLRSRSSFATRGRCWPSSACIRIARRRPATKRFAPLGAGIQIKWRGHAHGSQRTSKSIVLFARRHSARYPHQTSRSGQQALVSRACVRPEGIRTLAGQARNIELPESRRHPFLLQPEPRPVTCSCASRRAGILLPRKLVIKAHACAASLSAFKWSLPLRS